MKGPMGILRDLWINGVEQGEVHNTYTYVVELRNKLEETCELAQEHLQKSSQKQKHHYDKKAKDRRFSLGDKVLLLLPTDNNKLLLSWKGPFEIIEVINAWDYRILLSDGKSKIFHANLLKKYESRDEVFAVSVIKDCDPDELIHVPEIQGSESYLDVSINPNLSEEQKKDILSLICEYKDIFTDKPGCTDLIEHVITLQESGAVRVRPYDLPYATRVAIEKEVNLMLKEGIIERSKSDFCAPVVLVSKPDGSYRFCVNYKRLNKITKFDNEPMTRPDDILSKLSNKKYFSKLDFSRGFWQIPMENQSKEFTAFCTPSGCYHFCVMPFGLVNSPATYNRMMRRLLDGMEDVENYVDDVLGHSVTWEQHLVILRELFARIRKAGLTIRPTKCLFGFESISYLGHCVGHNKITPLDNTVNRILETPPPKTKKQLRSFLGLIGWYQKFIPNYSTVTACLTDLLQKGNPTKLKWQDCHEETFCPLSYTPIS